MLFEDFSTCQRNTRYYGGNAGNKYGITYQGNNWILKFPKKTSDLINPQISYTTSPLSEYIGSRIYALQGIPVHETILGTAYPPSSESERLVVACKDFRPSDQRFTDFKEIKNAQFFSDGTEGTSGNGTVLSEVLETISASPAFEGLRAEVSNRFWDQFVIDFIIGNNDRNNTNWGLLANDEKILGLAPVFDNGNAFFNKRSLGQFEKRLTSLQDVRADAYLGFTCAYLNDQGGHIHPHELIASAQYSGCNDALVRFMSHYNQANVVNLIDDIPAYDRTISILPQAQKEFYLKVIDIRINEVLVPTYKAIKQSSLTMDREDHLQSPTLSDQARSAERATQNTVSPPDPQRSEITPEI